MVVRFHTGPLCDRGCNSYPHFVPWFLLLEEISFGVDDGVEHAEGLLRADGHAAVAAVQLILAVVLSKEDV